MSGVEANSFILRTKRINNLNHSQPDFHHDLSKKWLPIEVLEKIKFYQSPTPYSKMQGDE